MIKCYFCDAEVVNVAAAVEAEWTPSFYSASEVEILDPVCPHCVETRLDYDPQDGEFIEKEKVVRVEIPDALITKIRRNLVRLQKHHDKESAHVQADDLLCELLEAAGLQRVVDAYRKIDRWYS
jgi:uncharacterized protein CbrC (UPF0167 family)